MTNQKISEFNVSTSLSDSDLFTFVVNGTNKVISYSDFKINIGVTGTLEQTGNALAAPVLSQCGDTYKIRNIESSKGIIASISAEDGVSIGANFSQSSTGVSIIENLNSDQYKVRTLVAGSGITLAVVGDTIEVSLT